MKKRVAFNTIQAANEFAALKERLGYKIAQFIIRTNLGRVFVVEYQ